MPDERFNNPSFQTSLDGWVVSGATWDSQYQGRCALNGGSIRQHISLDRVKKIIANVSTGAVRIQVDGITIANISADGPTSYGEVANPGTHWVEFQDLAGNSVLSSVSAPGSHYSPLANFSASPTSGPAPLTVTFTDLSEPKGDPIKTWQWTFENSGGSSAQNPTHTFSEEGKYTVSLRVDNGYGVSRRTMSNLIVVGTPEPGWPDSEWIKVGRLKPREDAAGVIIEHDQFGDIGFLTTSKLVDLLNGIEPQEIKTGPFNLLKAGVSDMSIPMTGVKMTIPADNGQLYVAISRQVDNMLRKWPTKKSALWIPRWWGIKYLESVFTITSILDCIRIQDINREFPEGIIGHKIEMLTGTKAGVVYVITGFFNGEYTIQVDQSHWDSLEWSYTRWVDESLNLPTVPPVPYRFENDELWICQIGAPYYYGLDTVLAANDINLNGAGRLEITYHEIAKNGSGIKIMAPGGKVTIGSTSPPLMEYTTYPVLEVCLQTFSNIGVTHNPSSPGFDIHRLKIAGTKKSRVQFDAFVSASGTGGNPRILKLRMPVIVPLPPECMTEGLKAGDLYRVLTPDESTIVLDDNSLALVEEKYIRASSGPGDTISTVPIQWYWDGAGLVYLSFDPVMIGPIMFDDELRIEVLNATGLHVRDFALGNERIMHSDGHVISRDTPLINSLLNPGVNEITVLVRDSDDDGYVGFGTPVYVKRKKVSQ